MPSVQWWTVVPQGPRRTKASLSVSVHRQRRAILEELNRPKPQQRLVSHSGLILPLWSDYGWAWDTHNSIESLTGDAEMAQRAHMLAAQPSWAEWVQTHSARKEPASENCPDLYTLCHVWAHTPNMPIIHTHYTYFILSPYTEIIYTPHTHIICTHTYNTHMLYTHTYHKIKNFLNLASTLVRMDGTSAGGEGWWISPSLPSLIPHYCQRIACNLSIRF